MTTVKTIENGEGIGTYNTFSNLSIGQSEYGLVSIHRNENTENVAQLQQLITSIEIISKRFPLVLIEHQILRDSLNSFRLREMVERIDSLRIIKEQPYLDYLGLLSSARFVLTDSSSIQDEAIYLDIPCIVCRTATHRLGAAQCQLNVVVGTETEQVVNGFERALSLSIRGDIQYPHEWLYDVGNNIWKRILG